MFLLDNFVRLQFQDCKVIQYVLFAINVEKRPVVIKFSNAQSFSHCLRSIEHRRRVEFDFRSKAIEVFGIFWGLAKAFFKVLDRFVLKTHIMEGCENNTFANNQASASFDIIFASSRLFKSESKKANGIERMFRSVINGYSFIYLIYLKGLGFIACLIIW